MSVPLCDEPLMPILALGELPLANALMTAEALTTPERRFPLTLAFCKTLGLVQIVERIPPEELFINYPYFSSTAEGAVRNAKAIADRLALDRNLGPDDLVIEIASNDGYLLQHYKARGVSVLGVEPAANIAAYAERERGIPTLVAFFDEKLGRALADDGRRAAVIHANNVFAHVPDPIGFLKGIARLLDDDGIAVIEAPYVKDMLDNVEFDTIYHEHLFYYSLTPVTRLCDRAGLRVVDVERLPIHGGSLRYFISANPDCSSAASVAALLADEKSWGVDEFDAYRPFATKVETLRVKLRRRLSVAKEAGMRLAAYGASAKGTTLMNYCGLDRETLDFVVDQSPHKQGYFTPGTHLPILAPEALLKHQPDAVLLLAWNFAEEILQQQNEYRRRGGKFIIPVPDVHVV